METQFTPIAMRCTEEQFKAIEPKLIKHGLEKRDIVFDLKWYPYLTNFYSREENSLGSTNMEIHKGENTKWLETWDEATFLKACGIELDTYTVSKDFILEAHESACSTWKTKIENQFPELFPKVELEVGKWYVAYWCDIKYIVCIESIDIHINTNGFNITESGRYTDLPFDVDYDYKWTLATKEEVETALINEAKKRGFEDGVKYEELHIKGRICEIKGNIKYHKSSESLRNDGWCLFQNGKWATIIEQPTEMTVAEIEAKLGCKIKIVG